jgi:hypothetical protein
MGCVAWPFLARTTIRRAMRSPRKTLHAYLCKFTVKPGERMQIERKATNIGQVVTRDRQNELRRSIIANVTAEYPHTPWQQSPLQQPPPTAITAACITRETRCV